MTSLKIATLPAVDKAAGPELSVLLRSGLALGILGLLGADLPAPLPLLHADPPEGRSSAGRLVWLPILQLFPLVRAAGMSGWSFVAWLVPLVDLVTFILVGEDRQGARKEWLGHAVPDPAATYFLALLSVAFSMAQPPRRMPRNPGDDATDGVTSVVIR